MICRPCTEKKREDYINTLEGFIAYLDSKTRKDCKRNGKQYNLTKKILAERYESQKGRCAISGRKMTFGTRGKCSLGKSVYNISIDRIDSSKGYTQDNIHLVCVIVNIMKSDLKLRDFVSLCYLIDSFQSSLITAKSRSNIISSKKNDELISFVNRYVGKLKSSAKQRDIKVNITAEHILEKFDEQKGKCNISGLQMVYSKRLGTKESALYYNISVDRINSNLGYTKDNIQLVCSVFNMMKNVYTMSQVTRMCRRIVKHQKIDKGDLHLPKTDRDYYKIVNGKVTLMTI